MVIMIKLMYYNLFFYLIKKKKIKDIRMMIIFLYSK